MLIVPVPQFHPEGKTGRDVVQVGIGQLGEKSVCSVIETGGRAPELAAFGSKLFEQPERVEVFFVLLRMRTQCERCARSQAANPD